MTKEALLQVAKHMKRSYLTPDLRMVADSLGMGFALKLAQRMGGITLHIPLPENLADTKDGKLLIRLMGREAAESLRSSLGVGALHIPQLDALVRAALPELVRLEYDGGNGKELALKYGVSQRTIEKRAASINKAKTFLKEKIP